MEAAAALAEAASWPEVSRGGDELFHAGRPFARLSGGRIEIRLAPGLRAMLVELGRAEPLDDASWVRAAAGQELERLRLAHARARVAERVRDARR